MMKKNKFLLILGCLSLGVGGISAAQILAAPLQKTDAASEAQFTTCGFESAESFTATTTYNSSTAISGGPTGKTWSIVGGAFSTSSAIAGSQSAAMRLYYNSSFYSSLKTNFVVTDMTRFSFSAKAATSNSAAIKINVEYSLDGTSWASMYTKQTEQTDTDKWAAKALTATAATYYAYLPSDVSIYGIADPYIKISIDSSSAKPTSSNAQLTIDSITFFGMVSGDSVSLASSSTKIAVGHDVMIDVNATSGTIVRSTSDAGVVTFEGDDTAVILTGVAAGTATITATVGTATATIAVTVIPAPVHAGTETDPYTVADAIRAIDAGLAVSGSRYYVSGLYISTTTPWSASYSNITIVLKDSTSDTASLTAYRMGAIVEPTLVENTTTVTLSATAANTTLYNGTTYEYSNGTYVDPDNAILDSFVTANLHTDVAYTDAGTGSCITSGWYATAKAAFNALTSRQRSLFAADTANYADAYKRLVAWATANGESLSTTSNTLGLSPVVLGNQTDSTSYYAIGVGIIVAALAAGLFIFRKKKQA